MIPLVFATPSSSPFASLASKRSLLPLFKLPNAPNHHRFKKLKRRKARNIICRAQFSTDATIGAAIGACVLNSLVFQITYSPEDDGGDSVIDSADARFAVMSIISFIPYFNWLSWFFAWLDTGRPRYAVYAIVYLAPYLRPNLSISPDESLLPIAGILLCIVHIQLEASMKNGDIQGLQLFSKVGKHLPSITRENSGISEEEERVEDRVNLRSAREHSRHEARNRGVPGNPSHDSENLHEDGEADGGSKH